MNWLMNVSTCMPSQPTRFKKEKHCVFTMLCIHMYHVLHNSTISSVRNVIDLSTHQALLSIIIDVVQTQLLLGLCISCIIGRQSNLLIEIYNYTGSVEDFFLLSHLLHVHTCFFVSVLKEIEDIIQEDLLKNKDDPTHLYSWKSWLTPDERCINLKGKALLVKGTPESYEETVHFA